MTLVPRTTTHQPAPPAAPASSLLPGGDPLRELEYASEPPDGPGDLRCIGHSRELSLRGIPVMCSACRARRDWLLINYGRRVWIRCRCSHQWLEPEITRADFDALITNPDWTTYRTFDEGMIAHGFDGSFAGTYLR